MISSLSILSLLVLNTLLRFFRQYKVIFLSIITLTLCIIYYPIKSEHKQFSSFKQPNLIIVGIDSLSPERINEKLTPNINKFLNQGINFKEVISPLARTYSAWTTILTGLYPLHHHARENLYPANMVKHAASLAWNLQSMGYQTLFASDDRRFNNLGEEFGFQEIIGPKIGVNDVLLGSFYDFPLSNPLINLRLSQWLLPYNYSNRAGHFSYYPSTFDDSLKRAVKNLNYQRPLFMAVHFTLPHWPYAWAISPPGKVRDEYNVYDREELYRDAVHQADLQVGNILQTLKHKGALANSIVIVLSDHGEVLYKKGARKTNREHYQGISPSVFENYLKRKTYTELEMSAGHGSDLLSPSQNHCILGVKLFKNNRLMTKPLSVDQRIGLIDIAPTIASLLNFSLTEKADGISLANTINNHDKPIDNRIFMLESGMLPNQSLTQDKVIEYAQSIFSVNPSNNRIQIRKDKFATINAMKLFGLIHNEWLIALYPDDKQYITLILNLNDGSWTDSPTSDFAKETPLKDLLLKLRQFYTKDLSNYPEVVTHQARDSRQSNALP